jgi:glycosyltransferase involved in cell wall biosynthesis
MNAGGNYNRPKVAEFLGRLTDLRLHRQFAEAEIFAGLSRSEALGNVFLEAQAAGCAVLATRTGGIPDIVHDDKSGLLIPPDDEKAAAEALEKLATDPQLRERLVKAGRENVLRYDWDLIAPKYAEVYRSLLL